MSTIDARDVPADPTSTERLSPAGFDYRVVDLTDDATADAFQRAADRGFLGAEPNADALAHARAVFQTRRNIGVYEAEAVPHAFPVATTNAWVTPLTLPGGGSIGMWAISMVTVAGTHRRRGIARALLEGELRAAASAGVPIAGLTASEATIYGRYGFGPAVPVARFVVDTRRAGWNGVTPPGRVEYVDRETLAADIGRVHDRTRRAVPGRIEGWQGRWEGLSGAATSVTERDKVRGVRYVDEAGEVRGAVAYTMNEKGDSFRFALDVRLLVAETPDALAALWRFVVQHDLVDQVTADLRPVGDALPWLVADQRAVEQSVHDHGWLRILDVPDALSARTYSGPLDLVIRVDDPLGFAEGSWHIQADADGDVTVEETSERAADVTIGVSALSALFVGGVGAMTLHAAGLIAADDAAVRSLDRAFAASPAPNLDIWY
ncbi:GNAT family N-acetyltransferase [Microbacterium sp. SA39]|uniref:GNAT family N-acetyltransferase n=1 Tax=Microbacterium sp. SA39 TaxID=1263625 RepID=UPI0005F9AE44|nr:GNAT family N-acetyltransferase [Microbacterium sp. SA39]KJQ55879.1 Enhanced intracellular survival protein [Microbacterium sp. SA39]